MGIGRKTSAISGGALALALGGGLPVLSATPAYALDCTGAGIVSGVTNTLCSVVGGVTGTVGQVTDTLDQATGGATAPLSETVNGTLDTVGGAAGSTLDTVGHTVDETLDGALSGEAGGALGKVGETVAKTVGDAGKTVGTAVGDTGKAVGETVGETGKAVGETVGRLAPDIAPTAGRITEGLTDPVRETCLPLLNGSRCVDPGGSGKTERPRHPRGHTAEVSPGPARGTLPVEPYRPRYVPVDRRTEADGEHVHPDTDGILPLLWPGQRMPEMAYRKRGKTVLPSRTHDPAGTALTAALLLSALTATRVVSARRARAGQRESIPLEGGIGLPRRTGRHRLA
ncbi:hypothetical protein ACQP1K_12450 [Sphaerimonospora sp. CA-214678]|uniref:hypothetical protein n=1 Tax=Sphaerimonospora sp. CA-214678 TaxID=3240029 RepID=UPI003D920276